MLSTWRARFALACAPLLGLGLWSNTLTDHIGYGSALLSALYASVLGCLCGAGLAATLRARGVAFARSEGSEVVERRHLFPPLTESVSASEPATWDDANQRFQRGLLQDTLDACDGNVSESARRLDLARSHLHELLRTHGIQRARSAP